MSMPQIVPRRMLTLALAMVCGGLVSASPLVGQDAGVDIDRERMVDFVHVHVAINEARDEFHGAVARVHDPEGRIRAREEVEGAIDAILEEAEMTRQEYDQITLLISLDGALRTLFEEVMSEIEGGGPNR